MTSRWRRLATSAVRSTIDRAHGSLHRLREERWPMSSSTQREALAQVRDVEGRLDRATLVRLYAQARAARGDVVELGPCDAQATCLVGALLATRGRKLYVVWPREAGEPSSEIAERYVRWHRHVLRKQLVPYVVPVLREEDGGHVPPLPERIELLVTHGEGTLPSARQLELGDER
jgi:hypothetical protein